MLCVLELFVRYVRILQLGLAGTTSGKGSQVTTLGYSYNWTSLLTPASSLPRLAPSRRETFGVVSTVRRLASCAPSLLLRCRCTRWRRLLEEVSLVFLVLISGEVTM